MRTNRPYVQIDPDVLERVRQIDLLSYLREFEPSNLVKVKGTSNVYCTAEHDSLKISNGKWYWWSRGFGGYSALDYLIKVKEFYMPKDKPAIVTVPKMNYIAVRGSGNPNDEDGEYKQAIKYIHI